MLATFALFALAIAARAADEMFDFETLRYRAKMLATKPCVPPASRVPEWLRKLTYDEHRLIVFDPDRSWWRWESLPFQLQFFHSGAVQQQTVRLFELRGKQAERGGARVVRATSRPIFARWAGKVHDQGKDGAPARCRVDDLVAPRVGERPGGCAGRMVAAGDAPV